MLRALANSAIHLSGVGKWVVIHVIRYKFTGKCRCGVLAVNTVWSTPERIRGEVLTTMRYTNRCLPYLTYQHPMSIVQRTVSKCQRTLNCDVKKMCCRKVAVTQDSNILVFHAPGQTIEFNPFVLYRTFYGAYDETTCIDWTSDSR